MVFADVHEFVVGGDLGGGASLYVAHIRFRSFERLKNARRRGKMKKIKPHRQDEEI